ncbi:MAG TPA: prolipoprotein diacylglyceryl transferase [Clostridia bacterium]|nr:prolipoprotein diacylglyceryl transferase [Clostridia bacterium]
MRSTIAFPNLFGGLELSVSRVAFKIGRFEVYWYGLLIAIAVCLAVVLVLMAAKKYGINEDDLLNICLIGIITGVISARLLYVLGRLDQEWTFADILNVRDGGMSIFGALIGGFIATAIYCKIKKINFLKLADLVVPYIALAQAIGRWGNFINKEAYGVPVKPSSILSSLAMTSMKIGGNIAGSIEEELYKLGLVDATLVANVNGNTFDYIGVHPTFFYESVLNLTLFLVLILVARNGKYFYGRSLCIYMASYGLYRFFIEGIRIDPLYLFNTDIKLSRLIALVSAIFFGTMLILISILRAKDKKLFMKSLIDEEEIQVGQSDYKDLLIDKDTYIPNNDIEVEIEKDKEEILHTDLEEASKESESVDK